MSGGMRDGEPLLRRIEALERRYMDACLPFASAALDVVRRLQRLRPYTLLRETLREIYYQCVHPMSFELVERRLLQLHYACVCGVINDCRRVVLNVYAHVPEDLIVCPAARELEDAMEELFVVALHRPRLHEFVCGRLESLSVPAAERIAHVLERSGEMGTDVRQLRQGTLQAVCRCLPDCDPALEVRGGVSRPPPPAPIHPANQHHQAHVAPNGGPSPSLRHVSAPYGSSSGLPPRTPPSGPAAPFGASMADSGPVMAQNQHHAGFFASLSPVRLPSSSGSDDDNGPQGTDDMPRPQAVEANTDAPFDFD